MTAPTPPAPRWPLSAYVLIAANCMPLAGVLLHHWTVFAVVLVYWCENVIVGVFNVLRMLTADPQEPVLWVGKAFLIPFFCVHYGMFTFVHGTFVFGMFGPRGFQHRGFGLSWSAVGDAIRANGMQGAIVALVVSHGFSFFHNYLGSGENRNVSLPQLMGQPYVRVVVLHVAILGGGFLVLASGSPLPALLLLIALKTAIDLRAHLAERTKLGGAAAAAL